MRLFFGATLPHETKIQISKIQNEICNSINGAKIEGVDKLHITLQFIGEFDSEKVEELASSVKRDLEGRALKSPLIQATDLSYFPNKKIRRGIWIDCRDDGTLAVVADSIKSVTRELGVTPEKRLFTPHITVARISGERRGGRRESSFAELKPAGGLQKLWNDGKLSIEKFFPTSVALFESKLKSSGSEYRILSEIGFKRD